MQNFNATERFFLKCCNKASIIVFMLGFMLCQYFLSERLLVAALVVKFLSIFLGIFLAWRKDPYKSAEKESRKAILTQAKPLNIVLCTAGLLVLYYGFWLDNYFVMIAGAGIMVVSSQWHLRKAKRAVSK